MFGSKPPHKIMLDNTNDPLLVRIERAAKFFEQNTKQKPGFCSVPPSAVKGELPQIEGMTIFTTDILTPGSIWMGVNHPGES